MEDRHQPALAARLSRRRLFRLGAGIALSLPALGGLLAACGGEDEEPSGSGDTTATTSTTEASPTAAPTAATAAVDTGAAAGAGQRGGTLRVALTGDLPGLDLHGTTDSIVLLAGSHLYETLFTWDADYRPTPLLAATHEISDDGLLHRVTLREGVTFHNGAPLTAGDVVASVERWGALSGLGEGLLEVTEHIDAVDDLAVEFTLNEPFGTFAMALARQLQGCAIYPASVLAESTETDLADTIGTGPYRLVEWQPDQHLLLERFDDYASPEGERSGYAGARAQLLDRIEFLPVPNEASRIAGMQAGDYDYLETASPDQRAAFEGAGAVTVETPPADSWLNIVLNLRSPALSDLRVRRAIQLALDHEAIMLAAFGDGFFELTPELVPGAPTWYSDAGSEYFNVNDPDGARALLAEAGYDGTPLRFMTTQEVQQEFNASLTIQQQLTAAGFTVDVQVYDGATLSDRRDDETVWEMYTASASFRPDPVMRNLTSSATGWWDNEEKDALIAQLQAESDYDKRFALWEQIQQAFYEDVPRLKIGNFKRILVRATALNDIGPTELQPDFASAWLAE